MDEAGHPGGLHGGCPDHSEPASRDVIFRLSPGEPTPFTHEDDKDDFYQYVDNGLWPSWGFKGQDLSFGHNGPLGKRAQCASEGTAFSFEALGSNQGVCGPGGLHGWGRTQIEVWRPADGTPAHHQIEEARLCGFNNQPDCPGYSCPPNDPNCGTEGRPYLPEHKTPPPPPPNIPGLQPGSVGKPHRLASLEKRRLGAGKT